MKGKRVLVRADLNVPVKDAKVTDATRLERLIPGLKDLSGRGAKVIIISHFGRPKNGPEAQFSLKPVADALSGLLLAPGQRRDFASLVKRKVEQGLSDEPGPAGDGNPHLEPDTMALIHWDCRWKCVGKERGDGRA